jgi:hypothetical protein
MLRLGVLAIAVAVLLAAAYGTPASARRRRRPPRPPKPPTQPVEFADQARLSQDRHTADVVLTVRCPSGATPVPIRVTLRQNGTSGSGRSGTNYKCNGSPQRVVVPVSSGGTFRRGSAQASVNVTFHGSSKGNSTTTSTNVSQTVQLV